MHCMHTQLITSAIYTFTLTFVTNTLQQKPSSTHLTLTMNNNKRNK